MRLDELKPPRGAKKRARRVGRGQAAGRGKTAGRGSKGQGSRSGGGTPPGFEGGQMPLFRRLPKRGFNNKKFQKRYEIINVSQLEKFDEGASVGADQLCEAGLIGSSRSMVKVLGNGELTKKLEILAHKFSKSAQEKISACGGTAKVIA